MIITQKPKGTNDVVGYETRKWLFIENVIRNLCEDFAFNQARTPVFEHTELFLRGVGETTDVVQKEMYTFIDKGDRSLTLKPENTAGIVRAFLEESLYATVQPTRMYYIAPCFRYEAPQAGRFREHTQFGVESFGSYSPAADAEVISLVFELFKRLGIKNVIPNINSLGGNECRQKYNEVLKNYIGANLNELCEDCKNRFEKNPLRVLDCKVKDCKHIVESAPSILDSLGEECKKHFSDVQKILTDMGIPFVVNEKIVRGLDYYTQTIFEFISTDIGTQGTVCGGGRYNNLVEQLGGQKTGAVGFGMGIERLIMVMENQGLFPDLTPLVELYIGSIGEKGFMKSQSLAYQLKQQGYKVQCDIVSRNVKPQLKFADKINAKYSCILGDDEIENNILTIKNMETGEKQEVTISELQNFLSQTMAKSK